MQRLISRFLPFVAAAAMALSATASQAGPLDQDSNLLLTGSESTGYTAPTYTEHLEAGSFLDTFRFTVTSPSLIEVTLITIGSGDDQRISFTNAWLNGSALSITTIDNADGTRTSFADISKSGLTGDLLLTVQGYAGGSLVAGTSIAASYSGVVNVIPASAVPEPQSGAMLLAGLGGMCLVMLRRRKV